MKRAFLIGAFVATACGASDLRSTSERFVNPTDGYSVAKPDGWTQTKERGLVVFSGSDARAKHRIVIRSALKPTAATDLVAATQRVLAALPGAQLDRSWKVDKTELPATELSLTYVPPNAGGKRYQRRHALVVGATRVLHVIYQAPVGEEIDQATFDAMVATIREEV